MPRYRIFTNDRGKRKGIPMYSCLCEITATSLEAAVKKYPADLTFALGTNTAFGPPRFAPIKAIEWPVCSESNAAWLKEHV